MATFDLDEADAGAATGLGGPDARAASGGGMGRLAEQCAECREGIRAWMLSVFYGRAEPDAGTDRAWKAKAQGLRHRAEEMLASVGLSEDRASLETALAGLRGLLDHWLDGKRAVGPGPRLGLRLLSPEAAAEFDKRLKALPLLPADKEPATEEQKMPWRKPHGC